MKKLRLGCLTLAILTTASSAFAAANQTWTGFYAGVNGGYGWGNQSITQTGSTTYGVASVAEAIKKGAIPSSLAGNPSGGLGGIEVGYNYDVNNFLVIGAIADYDWANVNASQTINTSNIPYFFPHTLYAPAATYAQQTLQSLGTVRIMMGLTPSNYPLLAYLTGGFGYGNIKTSANYKTTLLTCVGFCGSASSTNTNTGWVAGAGLAYSFYTNWSAKAEYLYYNLGSQSQQILDAKFPKAFLAQNVEVRGNVVRAGIDYTFM